MRSLIGGLIDVVNKAPVPYVSRQGLGVNLPFGMGQDDDTYIRAMGANSTVYAITHRLSESLSGVEWTLYRKPKSGLEEDRQIVTSHAAIDLWNRPNEFYTRPLFVETVSQYLALTGKAPWVLYRVGNSPPLEIWPVRPDRLHPVTHPTKFMTGWIYKLGRDEVPLGLNEVIRSMRIPNPEDPYSGLGAVQPLITDIESSKLASEYNRMFFVNGAEPGGIAEVDRRLSDDEFDELRSRWDSQHKGVSRAHRVAILENGLKWVERKYTRRDMQFSDLRKDSREVVREGFGMPKSVMGTTEDVNRANAEAGMVLFARWLMVPALERMKNALNYELMPMFGKGLERSLEWDYKDPTPENEELENATLTAKVNAAVALVNAGFDAVAVLDALGLPDIPFIGRPEPSVPDAPAPAFEPAARNGHTPLLTLS